MDPKRELAALSERAAALAATIERLRDELEAIQSEERALRNQLGMVDDVAELERAAARIQRAPKAHLREWLGREPPITPFDSEPTDNQTVVDSHVRSESPAPPMSLPRHPRAPAMPSTPPVSVSSAMLLRAGVTGAALTVGLAIVALLAADLLVRRQREPETSKVSATAPSAASPARAEPPPPSPPPRDRDSIPDPPPPAPPAAASLEPPSPPPPSLSSAIVPIVPRPVISSGVFASPPRSSASNPRDYGF